MTGFDALSKVEGFTPIEACKVLHQLAAEVPRHQAIVELGVYKARTACWLAAGAQSGQRAHVWAIDPWDLPGDRRPYLGAAPRKMFTSSKPRMAAQHNVRRLRLQRHVTLVRDFSARAGRAWDGPKVGLVFVDGDHRKGAVLADFEAWRPHMVDGAVVAFDDHAPPYQGVVDAVAQLASERRITEPEIFAGRLAVIEVL